MNSLVPTEDATTRTPVDAARLVDQLCDEFESSWQQGIRPEIAHYLVRIDARTRDSLLKELILIDLHYRHSCGEPPESQDYFNRFPNSAEIINAAFAPADSGTHVPLFSNRFAKLRQAVSQGAITDDMAELLLRGTPCGGSLLDTAAWSGTFSDQSLNRLSLILDEPPVPAAGLGQAAPQDCITRDDAEIDPGRHQLVGLPVRYRLTRSLGKGGMGEVFHAFDTSLRRPVAIKVLNDHRGCTVQAMHSESQILGRINHPNIVHIYDSGKLSDNSPYLVMEYVEGHTLAETLECDGCSAAEILQLIANCARAVGVAHYVGVVHRDLKPSNIMITTAERAIKILDFGLAQSRDDVDNIDHQVVGTMAYASPEQLEHAISDERSDVYALGVILFEALAGHRLIQLPPHASLSDAIKAKTDMIDTWKMSLKIASPVQAIIRKCLAPLPDRRYGNAAELADDIDRYLSRRPVLALDRQPLIYRLEGAFRPNGELFLFAVTTLLIVPACLLAGIPMDAAWFVLAVHFGFQGGNALLREAVAPTRKPVEKIALYGTGFMLLFEGILVFAWLTRRL